MPYIWPSYNSELLYLVTNGSLKEKGNNLKIYFK